MKGHSDDTRLDPAQARRAFARAASTYDAHAAVPEEIARRLLEHLGPVLLEPSRVLDVGAGTGTMTAALAKRYPRAHTFAIDVTRELLVCAQQRAPRWFSRLHVLCADANSLPLSAGAADLIASNLLLDWCGVPDPAFAQFARVLRPGGLLVFSALGPDTLCELRESWAAVDAYAHVHDFIDMHDLGDALMRAGFCDVVMETERLTIYYPTLSELMRELKALGAGNASRARARGLTSPERLRRVAACYEARRDEAGLPATCEVIYAHAWRPRPASLDVHVTPRRQS